MIPVRIRDAEAHFVDWSCYLPVICVLTLRPFFIVKTESVLSHSRLNWLNLGLLDRD